MALLDLQDLDHRAVSDGFHSQVSVLLCPSETSVNTCSDLSMVLCA